MRDHVWSVGDLLEEVNALLEQGFSGLRVEGEVTNVSRSTRGHLYFSLKDETAQMDCVMWASAARRLRFDLEDGLAVMAAGSLTLYRARGRFQMVVTGLEPQGQGALQLAFDQLKRRLAAEGLFSVERKRPLPAAPQRVGIVTSMAGAALRDMLKILRRHPHIETVLAPASVQGEGAAEEIAEAIFSLGSSGLVEVLIVARGGGSLEDLWAFNEEIVARAVAASPVPVISGVGHEVDFTICDFVADQRAATPTQAAELVVARVEEQERRLADSSRDLARGLNRHLQTARGRLGAMEGSAGLARVPQRLRLARARLAAVDRLPLRVKALAEKAVARLHRAEIGLERFPGRVAAGGHRRLVDSLGDLLVSVLRGRLSAAEAQLEARERALQHLSPRKVLDRGYSISTIEGSKTPLRDPSSLRGGELLVSTLARGSVRSLVAKPERVAKKGKAIPGLSANDQRSLFGDGGAE